MRPQRPGGRGRFPAGYDRSAAQVGHARLQIHLAPREVAMVDGIRINRAPVLTLWAAVVAEQLGYDADTAITLGCVVAGTSARIKARAIGLEVEKEPEDMRDVARREEARRARAALSTVHLLGRDIAVVEGPKGLRAAEDGKPASARSAHACVEKAFGAHLAKAEAAMRGLAESLPPEELNRVGFRLYERFRPEVPSGAQGWGAKGMLDLARIEAAAG